jgi:hypothetical protein
MNKAELTKLTKFVNDNIFIFGPGFQWIQDWESGKIKELPAKEELLSCLDKTRSDLEKTGEITLEGFLTFTQTCAFIKKRDCITGLELAEWLEDGLKKAPEEQRQEATPGA